MNRVPCQKLIARKTLKYIHRQRNLPERKEEMKKTKRVLSILLALTLCLGLLPLTALAAEEPERGVLTYTEVIAPQYEDAGQFSDGLAAVKKNGKWGYIDEEGKVVIPFQYELAYDFNEGLAIVAKSKRTADTAISWDKPAGTYYEMGFIDESGKYTGFYTKTWSSKEDVPLELHENDIDPENTYSLVFHNGIAVINYLAYKTTGMYVDIPSDYVLEYNFLGPVNEGLIPVTKYEAFGNSGWIDADGNIVKIYDEFEGIYGEPHGFTSLEYAGSFNQGLAPVAQRSISNGVMSYAWGFVDRSFQWVIPPQYTDFWRQASYTKQEIFGVTGLAMVCNQEGKWGAIDKTGATIIPFQYDALQTVSNGMIPAKLGDKWGYLDASTYKMEIPAQHKDASGFSDMGFAVVSDGSKAYLIDKDGKEIPGADKLDTSAYFDYNESTGSYRVYTPDDYVIIEENGKYGFGHIEYLPKLPDKSEMSDWAYETVCSAIEENLVPSYLQNLYRNSITRDEFCSLVVQTVEETLDQDIEDIVRQKTGKSLRDWQKTYPFTDSSDSDVIAANSLGIVSGRGNGIFDPYTTISRQEAASMLTRAAKVLGMDTSNAPAAGFADSSSMGDWSRDAINFIYNSGVMLGVGNNNFAPGGTYTREQSYMTVYRLFQVVLGK